MEAKQLQLVVTAFCVVGLVVTIGDVVLALARPGPRPRVRWRAPGVAMVACGMLVFVTIAWSAALSQPTLDELMKPADRGYWWFNLVPAALLAAVALQAAIRPAHAIRTLVFLAALPVVGLVTLVVSVALGHTPAEGGPQAIVASVVLVSLPAIVTASVLRSESAGESGRLDLAADAGRLPAGAPSGSASEGSVTSADSRNRARTERISAVVIAGVMIGLVALAGGFLFGPPRSGVTFHSGTATATDTEITLTADGATTTIPAEGVRWVLKPEGEWAIWSEAGRPSCLPPSQTPMPITFASVDVNVDVQQWRQVVLLVCLQPK